jgi:hypothetical protein
MTLRGRGGSFDAGLGPWLCGECNELALGLAVSIDFAFGFGVMTWPPLPGQATTHGIKPTATHVAPTKSLLTGRLTTKVDACRELGGTKPVHGPSHLTELSDVGRRWTNSSHLG